MHAMHGMCDIYMIRMCDTVYRACVCLCILFTFPVPAHSYTLHSTSHTSAVELGHTRETDKK